MNDPAYSRQDIGLEPALDTGAPPEEAGVAHGPSAPVPEQRPEASAGAAAPYGPEPASMPDAAPPTDPHAAAGAPEAYAAQPAAEAQPAPHSGDYAQPLQPAPGPQQQPEPETMPGQASADASENRARPLPRISIQAFCEDPNTASVLQEASRDRRLAKAHVTVQMGGVEAASAFYKGAPTPNLIVIESLHKRERMLADLERLAECCDAGTKVIVIGHVNDVLLYRELMHQGVSEYLVMPLHVGQVMECLSDLYTDPSADPLGVIISFIGSKGGSGSSTVCHNTAWAISAIADSDVVIADMDLPFGTAGLDFNQDPVQGIGDALTSPDRVDEVLLDRLLSRCSERLSLFAAPGTLDQVYDLEASACDKVVEVLRKNVPFIAVDVPHVWTSWAREVLIQSDHIVLTATPELASLRNAKNLIEKLNAARPNDNKPHLVVNQVGVPKRPEISVKDFAQSLDLEPFAAISFDAQLFGSAANNGQMIEEISVKSQAAEQFRQLALLLTGKTETKSDGSSLLAPILKKITGKKSKAKA